MANSIYATVCDALSLIISKRAAENIVREGLNSIGADPERITLGEMRKVLSTNVLPKLEQVIPLNQARREVKLLLAQLEGSNRGAAVAVAPAEPSVIVSNSNDSLVEFAYDDTNLETAMLETEAAKRSNRKKVLPRNFVLSEAQCHEYMNRFVVEEGVSGVMFSDRSGVVHTSKLGFGAPTQLAELSAATALLIEAKGDFDVFYVRLDQASAVVAPLGAMLLTVLGEEDVNVGRLLNQINALKEEL